MRGWLACNSATAAGTTRFLQPSTADCASLAESCRPQSRHNQQSDRQKIKKNHMRTEPRLAIVMVGIFLKSGTRWHLKRQQHADQLEIYMPHGRGR